VPLIYTVLKIFFLFSKIVLGLYFTFISGCENVSKNGKTERERVRQNFLTFFTQIVPYKYSANSNPVAIFSLNREKHTLYKE